MAGQDGERLSIGRVFTALLLAGLAAGTLTIILFAVADYLFGLGPGVESPVTFSAGQLLAWLVLWGLSILLWQLGLLLLGGPLWLVLHRAGLTRRFHALLVGALTAGVVGYVLAAFAYAPSPVAWFVAFSLIGMLAGWIVWARAYGRNGRIGDQVKVNTP